MATHTKIGVRKQAATMFSGDNSDVSERATVQRDKLLARFANRISVNPNLSRALVSWQSNRDMPGFRWFKFKEGFSTRLVGYLLGRFDDDQPGCLLDPFSGTGVAPITAARNGWSSIGIEILPVGAMVTNGLLASAEANFAVFRRQAADLLDCVAAAESADVPAEDRFQHIRITQKAFPDDSEKAIAVARHYLRRSVPGPETALLELAAVSALEDASWTSKDGQYLRWDHRSGRRLKAKMEKRCVMSYQESLHNRLNAMMMDLPILAREPVREAVRIVQGSCYDALPDLPANSIDGVITSPPYANRYDYTRTYALELAWLGYDDDTISGLRQRLLSATVENRSKREELATNHSTALAIFDSQPAIAETIDSLEHANRHGELPNPHIIRLVRNYFMEMTVVVAELARICRSGASVFMVNDNVQYHGEEVPVDLILSDLAEQCGFETKAIWTLARGKGNASQQMGRFGRKELRKCVYWWVKK